MYKIEETFNKKTFKVTIPLIYEVIIDTNDETKKALIDYMGLETVIRNAARRMFLLDTSPNNIKDSHDMSEAIRKKVNDFWDKDVVKIENIE